MSTKNRFQKRAREIQKRTGWSYTECLRLANEEVSDEGIKLLMNMRKEKVVKST